jgi:hypothetical protein
MDCSIPAMDFRSIGAYIWKLLRTSRGELMSFIRGSEFCKWWWMSLARQ